MPCTFVFHKLTDTPIPSHSQITVQGDWTPWSSRVPQIEVETHMVAAPDLVIPTVDTVRHGALLYTWLAEHKPLGTECELRLKLVN